MDFENERYVRLYTRDTTTWKLLPWQGKVLIGIVMRKLDRLGVIDLEKDGWDALAAVTDMPRDVITVGMSALLERGVFGLRDSVTFRDVSVTDRDAPVTFRDGVVTICDGTVTQRFSTSLVMYNYRHAQEAKMSDSLRAREHRARSSANTVTKRDAPVTKRDGSSRAVTRGHTASLLAQPSINTHTQKRARVDQSPSQTRPPTEPDPDAVRQPLSAELVRTWATESGGRISPGATTAQLTALDAFIESAVASGYEVNHIASLGEWANKKGPDGFSWMDRRYVDLRYLIGDDGGGNLFRALDESREWFESSVASPEPSKPQAKQLPAAPPPKPREATPATPDLALSTVAEQAKAARESLSQGSHGR